MTADSSPPLVGRKPSKAARGRPSLSWTFCLCSLLCFFIHVTTATATVSRALNASIIVFGEPSFEAAPIEEESGNSTVSSPEDEHSSIISEPSSEAAHSEESGNSTVSSEEEHSGGESDHNELGFDLIEGHSEEGGGEHENEPAHAVLFPAFTLTLGLLVFFLLTR